MPEVHREATRRSSITVLFDAIQPQLCLFSQKTAARRVTPIIKRKVGTILYVGGRSWLTDGEIVKFGVGVGLGVKLGVGMAAGGDGDVGIVVSVGVSDSDGVSDAEGVGVGVCVTDTKP